MENWRGLIEFIRKQLSCTWRKLGCASAANTLVSSGSRVGREEDAMSRSGSELAGQAFTEESLRGILGYRSAWSVCSRAGQDSPVATGPVKS